MNKILKAALVLSTILSSGAFLIQPAQAASEIIAQETGTPGITSPSSTQEAAAQFVHLLSQARYSLKIEDKATARQFINEAKAIGAKLPAKEVEGVKSGRVGYGETALGNFYYPAGTDLVTKKEVALGPFWADKSKKGLAVKDAELVYLTVDASEANIQKSLDEALKEIADNDLSGADRAVSNLLDDVAEVDDEEEALAVKASDNLELANYYLAAKNYDAARYPLKHAKDALEEMKDDDTYKGQRSKINAYLNQIDKTEDIIAKRDPNAMEKMQQDITAWWKDIKSWFNEKKSS